MHDPGLTLKDFGNIGEKMFLRQLTMEHEP